MSKEQVLVCWYWSQTTHLHVPSSKRAATQSLLRPALSVNIGKVTKRHRELYIVSLTGSHLSNKIATYGHHCGNTRKYGMQASLSAFVKLQQRRTMSFFTTGSHWLKVQTGRHKREKYADRIYEQCITGAIEDEDHFLLMLVLMGSLPSL